MGEVAAADADGVHVRHSAPQPGRQPRLQMYAVR